MKLGLILDTPETQNKKYYFTFTSKAFAASINTGVNSEINLWCSTLKENVPLHFWLLQTHLD